MKILPAPIDLLPRAIPPTNKEAHTSGAQLVSSHLTLAPMERAGSTAPVRGRGRLPARRCRTQRRPRQRTHP